MIILKKGKGVRNLIFKCLIPLACLSCCLLIFYCAPKKQAEPANLKPNNSKIVERGTINIDKNILIGIWGTSTTENAAFQIQGDTIYYPDANRRLKYALLKNIFICFDEKGDTNFSCIIYKLDKDSLIMEDNRTKEKSAFVRFP